MDVEKLRPRVCFEVERVIGVSDESEGNVRSYRVQWAPAWVSGYHLLGCEHLIHEFLQQQSDNQHRSRQQKQEHNEQHKHQRHQHLQKPRDFSRDGCGSAQEVDSSERYDTGGRGEPISNHRRHFEGSTSHRDEKRFGTRVERRGERSLDSPVSHNGEERCDVPESDSDVNQMDTVDQSAGILVVEMAEVANSSQTNEDEDDDTSDTNNNKKTQGDKNNDIINRKDKDAQDSGRISSPNSVIQVKIEDEEVEDASLDMKDSSKSVTTGVAGASSETISLSSVSYIKYRGAQEDNAQDKYNGYRDDEYDSYDRRDNIDESDNADSYDQQPLNFSDEPSYSFVNRDGGDGYYPSETPSRFFPQTDLAGKDRPVKKESRKPKKSTKERSHSCMYCDKVFIHHSNLKRHLITHTSDRPFVCEQCNKTFKRKDILNEHMWTHTPQDKPHKCPVCDLAFTRNYALQKHLEIHRKDGSLAHDVSPQAKGCGESPSMIPSWSSQGEGSSLVSRAEYKSEYGNTDRTSSAVNLFPEQDIGSSSTVNFSTGVDGEPMIELSTTAEIPFVVPLLEEAAGPDV